MVRGYALVLGAFACTPACSDDGPVADPYRCVAAGGEGCFELPTDVIGAADASGAAVLPLLDCADYAVASASTPIAFSGHTVDLDVSDQWIGDVRVEAFADLAMTSLLFDVTSDVDGAWAANAAVPNLAFARTTATGQLPLHFVYARVDINVAVQDMVDLQTATKDQVTAALERAGDRFLPGKSQLGAFAYDCNGNRLVHAVANIAPVSGRNGSRLFEPNVRTYYGIEGDTPTLGRRTELAHTSSAGLIGIANIPPGTHFVQLWGFPDASSLAQGSLGLELLAEQELVVPDGEAGFLMPLYGRL